MSPVITSRLESFLAHIAEKGERSSPRWYYLFRSDTGPRFTRIVVYSTLHHELRDKWAERIRASNGRAPIAEGNGSVFLFVENETGKIHKPEGYKKPSKDARYDLMNEQSFAQMMERGDIGGSFLYKR